jgi:hypothetical protein
MRNSGEESAPATRLEVFDINLLEKASVPCSRNVSQHWERTSKPTLSVVGGETPLPRSDENLISSDVPSN